MRKIVFLFSVAFLLGCPTTEKKPEEAKDDTSKQASNEETKEEPEKAAPDVSIFGFNAKTAMYKKGKDGTSDTLEFGGVDDRVYSPDGEHMADMLKVIESNLFPEKEVTALDPKLKDAKNPEADAAHAWLVWMDDKQVEVALRNPFYSAGAATLKFDVEVVDGTLPEGSLGKAELRLQDCPDQDYQCAKFTLEACNATTGKVGTCWQWAALNCLPCHCSEDMAICKKKDPKCCGAADAPCYPSRLGPHGWERYCL
jgi:hypothetical protein